MSLTSLYYDPARPDDPRPALAVQTGPDTRVLLFEDGSPSDEGAVQDLRGLLDQEGVAVLETHVGPALDLLNARSLQRHELDPATEVRLRVLTGRARKETPYTPPVADLPVEEGQDLVEEGSRPKGSYLSRAVEGLQRYVLPVKGRPRPEAALSDGPELTVFDEPVTGGGSPLERAEASDPHEADDLDDFPVRASEEDLSDIMALRGPEKTRTPPSEDEPTGEELDLLFDEDLEAGVDLDLEEDSLGESWEDLIEGLDKTGPDQVPEPDFWAHLIQEKDWHAALQGMLDALEDRWGYNRAVAGVRAEIHKVTNDPLSFLSPDGHELWAVHLKDEPFDQDRMLIQAWTDKVQGRMRLRMLSASGSPAHRPLLEEAMRALVKRMTSLEFGPVEALVPEGVRISPDLLRAGGFEHVSDLRQWFWGTDCALWVRPPRQL